VAHVGLHFGEEPPISGSNGSGTIFFAHCNLRCVFCQNHQISQGTGNLAVRYLSDYELADEMLSVEKRGAHNVNLVSPSHVVAQIASAITIARGRGLRIPVVYNTNGYDAVDTLRELDGLIDIYLPDIKYSSEEAAEACSAVSDYVPVNRRAIAEMFRQVGNLLLDDDGLARRGLLVRHLVLPENLAGSRASLAFLASLSPEMVVGLMSQYSPQHRADEVPALSRRITYEEYERVIDWALELGLENCFVQELESTQLLVPDFGSEEPFGNS